MPRGVAINVGANTNVPGFRGPLHPDGSFEFVPIPETAPTVEPVPTYGDLPLSTPVPDSIRETPVHLDPSFDGYGPAEGYTYGDPWGVKARPLLDLATGDHVWFYATLSPRDEGAPVDSSRGDGRPPWSAPDWGAYLIGRFELARDPVTGEAYAELSTAQRAAFAGNAHLKRDPFDAAVLLLGDPGNSGLFGRAIPLSGADAGVEPNRLVTEQSADSGRGPWWRRPLGFDGAGVDTLLALEGADDGELLAIQG